MCFTVYTRNDCQWCDRAKVLLTEYGKAYEEINIHTEPMSRERFIEFITPYLDKNRRPTVPQIFDAGSYIGGFEDLSEYLRTGKVKDRNVRTREIPSPSMDTRLGDNPTPPDKG